MRWLFPFIISLSLLTAPQGGFAQTVDELYQQGAAAYELKKYTEAESFFRRVIEIDSRNAKAYSNLGNALSKQGKLEEAISNFNKALALDPNFAIAYYNLGDALSEQGKLEEAISNYNKALAIDPNYAKAYNNLGVALYEQGKLEEAISNFNKSLAIDPNNATAQNNLKEAERLLARQTTPPPPNPDDRQYLPSVNDNLLLPSLRRSTPLIIATVSSKGTITGAGWVMKREGNIVWIVTCRHVVSDRRTKQPSQKIEIELYSELSDKERARYSATIEKITSPADNLDIAVLKVSGIPSDVQPLTLKLGRLPPTSAIKVIGHPFNVPDPWTVVSGEVINYNSQNPTMSIDATVAEGNSGGPVINDKGEMIGMMISIYNRGDVAVDPNVATPAILDNTAATGGVGLAYRTEVILQQLKAWGYEL